MSSESEARSIIKRLPDTAYSSGKYRIEAVCSQPETYRCIKHLRKGDLNLMLAANPLP